MKDSLQKISPVTQMVLMEEQIRQTKEKGKKPTFKQLIADAVWDAYDITPADSSTDRGT